MSQQAIVRGEVEFRAGDGMKLPVPDGAVEIQMAEDSVTLHWMEGKDALTTAITRDEFDRYVKEGKIRVL